MTRNEGAARPIAIVGMGARFPGARNVDAFWNNLINGRETVATLDEATLVRRLSDTDAAVIMKVGRNLAKVRRAVEAAGCMDRALYVERATMADERILPLAQCTEEHGPYFAIILIPGCGRQI